MERVEEEDRKGSVEREKESSGNIVIALITYNQ